MQTTPKRKPGRPRKIIPALAEPKRPASVETSTDKGSPSGSRFGTSSRDQLAALIVKIEADLAVTPAQYRAALYGQLKDTHAKIAKLDGEGEITVSTILRAKSWREAVAILLDALEPFPEALRACTRALQEHEDGIRKTPNR
jgi:hypothetical protein